MTSNPPPSLSAETLPCVLVVDDEELVARSIEQWLGLSGFQVIVALSVADAMEMLKRYEIDAILSDVRMPGQDGLSFLRSLRRLHYHIPMVLLTAHGDVNMAVEALKAGAFDFLTKPHDPDRLATIMRNACEQQRLRQRIFSLEGHLAKTSEIENRLMGRSQAMQQLRADVLAIANTPIDVVIHGETGTGKEVVARALHDFSSRRLKPFVAINCAAIPSEMVESELFGHEAGAFTGAQQLRIGKFEHANGGTVFLDEIESMPVLAQTKVLRVLQERVVERVGSNRLIPVDVRIVSASKADLREASAQGQFRADIYFRLAGFELRLPPLRQRGDDILQLFNTFATLAAKEMDREPPKLSPQNLKALMSHDWPGNVRELRAIAKKFGFGLGLSLEGSEGQDSDLDTDVIAGCGPLDDMLERYERAVILAALQQAKGSVAAALEILKIPRRTLNEKMKRLNISRNDAS